MECTKNKIFKRKKNRILHIGSNDVIGRSLKQCNTVDVVSHISVKEINLSNYDVISVSAFDPARKKITRSCKLIQILIRNCSGNNQKIIYYTTCRVFDDVLTDRHKHYVNNKLSDVASLRSHFRDVSVVYLPIIIPNSVRDNSPFFENFFKNFLENRVQFDVAVTSSWNFIKSSEFVNLIHNHEVLENEQCLLSQNPVEIGQMITYLGATKKSFEMKFGDQRVDYPGDTSIKKIFSIIDTGASLEWLSKLRDIYSEQ